jgi:hypothetical protein
LPRGQVLFQIAFKLQPDFRPINIGRHDLIIEGIQCNNCHVELTSVNSSVNPTLKMGAAQINDFFMASLWHSEVKGLAQIQVESTQSCWMSGSIRQKWGAVSVVPASPVTMSATQLGLTNT